MDKEPTIELDPARAALRAELKDGNAEAQQASAASNGRVGQIRVDARDRIELTLRASAVRIDVVSLADDLAEDGETLIMDESAATGEWTDSIRQRHVAHRRLRYVP